MGGYEARIRGLFTRDGGSARQGSRNADGLGRGLARIQVELCMKLSILKIERQPRRRAKHDRR